ncbi:hypothetical protein J6590_100587 [Homalodisca vitripennis]|nr:hypothetical protein J6590_100587 [Homalodisca vitripennis]
MGTNQCLCSSITHVEQPLTYPTIVFDYTSAFRLQMCVLLFQFSRLHSSPRETILQNRLLCVTASCSSSADFTPLHARIPYCRTDVLCDR